jgi:hypothetical protein
MTDALAARRLDPPQHGLEFSVVTFIERILVRGQKPRLILRIALSS